MATVLDCDRGTPTRDSAVTKDRGFRVKDLENSGRDNRVSSRLVSSVKFGCPIFQFDGYMSYTLLARWLRS